MLPFSDVKSCLTEDDECVSDLSDDDSYPDCYGYAAPRRRSTSCNAAIECFQPSMVPERVKPAMTNTKKQVLVLTNVSSMQSLAIGSEKDDAPRIPSRTKLSSDATPAVWKHHTLTNDTMCNQNWDDFQKPAARSSNLLLSRIQAPKLDGKSFITLDRYHFSKAAAEGSRPFQKLQTASRRKPPSRTDLRSASMPTVQYDVTDGTNYRNATWIGLPTNPLLNQQPFCSSFNSPAPISSDTINLTPRLKNKLLHVPNVTSLHKSSSCSTDSAPRLPKRTPFT